MTMKNDLLAAVFALRASVSPISITFLATAFTLVGCDSEIRRAKQAVEAGLKDPGSVEYEQVTAYNGGVVCGKYNAKNSFGGYVGFKPFITLDGQLARGSESGNNYFLCTDSTEKKVEIGAVDLGRIEVKTVSAANGRMIDWRGYAEIWVEYGKETQLEPLQGKLKSAAVQFLTTNSMGLSRFNAKSYDPLEKEALTKALQSELQKLTQGVEVKKVSLLLY